jgi:cyclohexyl-isocyanide hydratase
LDRFAIPGAFAALRGETLTIGVLMFPNMDQIYCTGPFEMLSRVPDARVHLIGSQPGPFRTASA